LASTVVKEKAVSVGGEREGHVEHLGVIERLLHSRSDDVRVVLRLDDREREVLLPRKDVVGVLRLATRDEPAANDDPATGEVDFFADLRLYIPAAALERRRDELRADVALRESALIHF